MDTVLIYRSVPLGENEMPLTFQDRASAFEAKHAHDQDLIFRAIARRDKLFAKWLATKRRSTPEEADRLRKSVLAVADGPEHDENLLTMVRMAIGEHPEDVSVADLASGLAACAVQAWQELLEAPPHLAVKGHL